MELTGKQIIAIYDEDYTDIPQYEGWSIDYDTDTGDFDSEKGAMYDFEIYLYDKDGSKQGTAIGGYYTGVTGLCLRDDENYSFDETSVYDYNTVSLTEVESRVVKAMMSYIKNLPISAEEALEDYEGLSEEEITEGLRLLKINI